MIVETFQQGSPAWHKARRGVVTASGLKMVMTKGGGKTRARYMQKLAHERAFGESPEEAGYMSEAMLRGIELEPQARRSYEQLQGVTVKEIGIAFLNEDRRIAASPDGLVGADGGIEIKCPLPSTHEKYVRAGIVPATYRAQVQGNLWITGRKWWDFVSHAPDCHGHVETFIHRAYRDESYISVLQTEVTRFMEELDALTELLAGGQVQRA